MTEQRTLTVALLAMPETSASTIYGLHDVVCSAGRDWDFLTKGVPGRPLATSAVVARTTEPFCAANGAWIHPDTAIADCAVPDLLCIPELVVAPEEDIRGRFPIEEDWVRTCYKAGSTIASVCSGAVLLAEAGLLDGGDATTHWGYCEALGRRYPNVRVHPSRVLVATGEGQRIITSGGGMAWQDLTLYLVARFFGPEEAMRLARIHLMDWHQHGQQPFSMLAASRQIEDRLIADCQQWIADHYADHNPVAAMALRSGLPERSFKRRFSKSTGMPPLEYVHTVRLEEAKQILETTDLPVEAVAGEVGYEDGSFFRRLFKRKVGLTPAAYRKKFGTVRSALKTADGIHATE